MSLIVVDASVPAAWYLPGQRTDPADVFLREAHEHEFAVPHIFPTELCNIFLVAERKGRIAPASTALAFQQLSSLGITVVPAPALDGMDPLFELAREQRLTGYDVAYLHLALDTGARLASRDEDLLEAAKRRAVDVLDLRS